MSIGIQSALLGRSVTIFAGLLAVTGVLAGCGSAPEAVPTAPSSAAGQSSPVVPAQVAPTAPPPPTQPPPAPAEASVHPVIAAELGATWRPGCPLAPQQLRRVEVDHIGFDGQVHRGALIVHEDLVGEVISIFEQLYLVRYPIEKMRTPDHYPDADDELSMADNNTSAFNCRGIPGTDKWSQHAYGRAVDVNPLLNPFVDATGAFQPNNAGEYLDRSRTDPGMLHSGDAAVLAFTDRGWQWGGYWRTPIDYQHFERP